MYVPKSTALLALLGSSELGLNNFEQAVGGSSSVSILPPLPTPDHMGSLSKHDQFAILSPQGGQDENEYHIQADSIEESSMRPYDVLTAASIARTLLYRESLLNLATIDVDTSTPAAFMEYYADCPWVSATDENDDNDDDDDDDDDDDNDDRNRNWGDGSPFLLALNMSTSYRNIAHGSKASISIRTGDHPITDHHVNPSYPGSIVHSPAGSPRVKLDGVFVDVEGHKKKARVTKCFLGRHKDAVWWIPGSPVHGSKFVQFKVEKVYFIGGFGDRAYIGDIPLDIYQSAPVLKCLDPALL
ncbi:hypothetical protein NADFUDRAFT_45758 [Nadsonia fulvescens var. elongata DSM 6958]|uniref:CREG-like beta-barrel domain-containing protein n=1 Tax=Nadsonia fulvescens var. elongata DSM 6958 TaxID=857566 RepID=A0A1E3PLC3_9ASCO|nr:hypothetical protein NADFUDRAFT_45758 [Nadsonia fulvescens var. elongata DSM 6958]